MFLSRQKHHVINPRLLRYEMNIKKYSWPAVQLLGVFIVSSVLLASTEDSCFTIYRRQSGAVVFAPAVTRSLGFMGLGWATISTGICTYKLYNQTRKYKHQ